MEVGGLHRCDGEFRLVVSHFTVCHVFCVTILVMDAVQLVLFVVEFHYAVVWLVIKEFANGCSVFVWGVCGVP